MSGRGAQRCACRGPAPRRDPRDARMRITPDGSRVSERGSGARWSLRLAHVTVRGLAGRPRAQHGPDGRQRDRRGHRHPRRQNGRDARVTAANVERARAAVVRRLVPLVVEAVAVHDHMRDVGQNFLDSRRHEGEHDARDDPQRDIRRPPPSILATLPHGPMMHRKRSACNGGGGTTHGAAPAAIHATMRQASREPSACAGGILTRRSLDVTRRTSSLQCGRSGKTSVRRASRSAS